MKKLLSILSILLIINACGPTAEQRALIEKAKQDSISVLIEKKIDEKMARQKAIIDSLAEIDSLAKANQIAKEKIKTKIVTIKGNVYDYEINLPNIGGRWWIESVRGHSLNYVAMYNTLNRDYDIILHCPPDNSQRFEIVKFPYPVFRNKIYIKHLGPGKTTIEFRNFNY